jgi:hypothetical protein
MRLSGCRGQLSWPNLNVPSSPPIPHGQETRIPKVERLVSLQDRLRRRTKPPRWTAATEFKVPANRLTALGDGPAAGRNSQGRMPSRGVTASRFLGRPDIVKPELYWFPSRNRSGHSMLFPVCSCWSDGLEARQHATPWRSMALFVTCQRCAMSERSGRMAGA